MATQNQNLFEKYGIKEVADVTFYRIEKKTKTYEAQRTFSIATVIKGSVEERTVYPLENGVGTDEGFQAYVFTDADLITKANYDCDDQISAKITVKGQYIAAEEVTTLSENDIEFEDLEAGKGKIDIDTWTIVSKPIYEYSNGYPIFINNLTQRVLNSKDLEEYDDVDYPTGKISYVKKQEIKNDEDKVIGYLYDFTATFDNVEFKKTSDLSTGVFNTNNSVEPDADKEVGTHEFTYAEQVFINFAKRQNLINKNGTRYRFANADELIGELTFEDEYTLTPNSSEKVVVLGLASNTTTDGPSWSEGAYNIEEVNAAINKLTQSYQAKAYDVVYDMYAELVVEDEMGYYNHYFLGSDYNKATKTITNFNSLADYRTWAAARKGVDFAIANATMWGNNQHYSINDAIDALRQQQKILDTGGSESAVGIKRLYGGYKVSDKDTISTAIPTVGREDIDYDAIYKYFANNTQIDVNAKKYSLEEVLAAISELSTKTNAIGENIRVDYNAIGDVSNRAIYVRNVGVDTATNSYIYLLHNKNYRKLAADNEGVFTFEDKRGNKLYYQDKIFKQVEWLALVVIGDKGMIFVVNRHGDRNVSRVAWMINNGGYADDIRCAKLVKNGLIHTTDITANNETFEATCEVAKMYTRKTEKTVTHYVPVLYLDTLKVSTLEQTAEEVYATGGKGNANLIGWDYGKEITLNLEDALFTPASMSAMIGAYEGNDFRKGVKDVKTLDRFTKVTAKRSFIVPAGNMNGTPTEADKVAQAVFYDPKTMEPYPDGTPIAEGEIFYKFTRSVAYDGESLGHMIEISADKFPGTYKIVGDTYARAKDTGEDQRFQFVIPQAKMGTEWSLTLEADGDPVVFDMTMTVLRPDDGVMVKFIQYDVIENEEQNDGSDMVNETENLNLLDDAELFEVSSDSDDDFDAIGATEY